MRPSMGHAVLVLVILHQWLQPVIAATLAEIQALTTLYSVTNGIHWSGTVVGYNTKLTGAAADPCTGAWSGVTCGCSGNTCVV